MPGFIAPATPPATPEGGRESRAMRLVASNLACIRGGRHVLSGLGFSLASGEALLLTGPNGAGKSSLLRLVAGLVPLADGQISLDGGDPEVPLCEQAHYLGHQDAVKPALSVRENLDFWVRFLGDTAIAIDPALAGVGLDGISHLPAGYLSAGQRRRLSIARLIAVPRPIWLLDEPASALDSTAQATLAKLMTQHLAVGGMIIAATHGPIGLQDAKEMRLEPLSRSAPLRGKAWEEFSQKAPPSRSPGNSA